MVQELLVPLQFPPIQRTNPDAVPAVAVSATAVLRPYVPVQVAPQVMPAGVLLTVPLPLPGRATPITRLLRSKLAVTFCAALMVTAQVPVPVQAPLQPAKVEPLTAVAVSVTLAPGV